MKLNSTRVINSFETNVLVKSLTLVVDTLIHQHVLEQLTKSWAHVENNLETCAIQLYRRIFKLDQDLFPLFPFYKDEWTRVTFTDYNGFFSEQAENTWFLLFR